jgi:hypothetical protein
VEGADWCEVTCQLCQKTIKGDARSGMHVVCFKKAISGMDRGSNKFNAKRAESRLSGSGFHSQGERDHCDALMLLERAGVIRELACQVRVEIHGIGSKVDFSYFDTRRGEQVWDEFKGVPGERWRVFKALWSGYGPGLLLVHGKDKKGRIQLIEEIRPAGARHARD